MKPKCYESVAKDQVKLQVKPGFTVSYDHGATDVKLHADQNLQNPSFESKFKLEPGKVSLKIEGGKVARLELEPDLDDHDAKLSILPIEGGQFKFEIKKKCPCSHLGLQFGYNSAQTQGFVTVKPEIVVKDQVRIKSKLSFRGTNQDYPILLDRLRADYKNIRLASCYQPDEKEWRAGLFVDLRKAHSYVGTRLHFSQELKFLAADLFARTTVKGIHVSTVTTLSQTEKPNVFTLNVEGVCPHQPESSVGARLTYAGKDFSGKFGVETLVKGLKAEGVLTAGYLGEKNQFTAGVDAQVKFPLHGFGKGTLGLNIKDLLNIGTPGLRFNVELH